MAKTKLDYVQDELKKTEADFFYDLRYLQARLPTELAELEEKYPKQDVSNLRSCLENILKSIESLVESSEVFYKAVEKDPFGEPTEKAFRLHLENLKSPIALYAEYQGYISLLEETTKSSNSNIAVSQEKGMPPPDQRMVDNTKILKLFDTLNKFMQRASKYPLLFKEMMKAEGDARPVPHSMKFLKASQSAAASIEEAVTANQQHLLDLCLESMNSIRKKDKRGSELLAAIKLVKTPGVKQLDNEKIKEIFKYIKKKSPKKYEALQKNYLNFVRGDPKVREAWSEYKQLDSKIQQAESGFSEQEIKHYRAQMLYVKERLYQGDSQGAKKALGLAEVFFTSRELGIQIEELKKQCELLNAQLQALPEDAFTVAKGEDVAEILTSLNAKDPTTFQVSSKLVEQIGKEINEHKELSSATQLYATLEAKIETAPGETLTVDEMRDMQGKLAKAQNAIARNAIPEALGFLQEIQSKFSEIEGWKKLTSLNARTSTFFDETVRAQQDQPANKKTSRLSIVGVGRALLRFVNKAVSLMTVRQEYQVLQESEAVVVPPLVKKAGQNYASPRAEVTGGEPANSLPVKAQPIDASTQSISMPEETGPNLFAQQLQQRWKEIRARREQAPPASTEKSKAVPDPVMQELKMTLAARNREWSQSGGETGKTGETPVPPPRPRHGPNS